MENKDTLFEAGFKDVSFSLDVSTPDFLTKNIPTAKSISVTHDDIVRWWHKVPILRMFFKRPKRRTVKGTIDRWSSNETQDRWECHGTLDPDTLVKTEIDLCGD